jgi:hypothetical protein
MNIGEAVTALRAGKRVCRPSWNGKEMWLALQVPDGHSKMTTPYVYLRAAHELFIPWTCSQADLLATDWEEYA